MKNIKPLVGIAALVLIACAPAPAEQTPDPQKMHIGNGIYATRDYEHGVVCYSSGYSGGASNQLSCVKMPEQDATVQFR